MPIGRVGEHDTRDKGPERSRQVQAVHQRRAREHCEQPDHNEQFALAIAPDELEQRVENEAPGENEAENRTDRIESKHPAGRRRRIGRRARQRRDDGDHRNDGEILKQQDREGLFAEGRIDAPRTLEPRQNLRGRRQRKRKPECDRGGKAESLRQENQPGQDQAGDCDLRHTEPENRAAQLPQAARMEFESDKEEKEGDPDFGNRKLRLGAADESEPMWSDQRPGNQIAKHGAKAESPK